MNQRMLRSFSFAALLLIGNAAAQEADRYEPVKAPYAQKLVQKAMAAHPEMLFIGLHAIPPGKTDNLIIACNDPAKIGKVSTSRDMELVKNKGTNVQFNEKHKYYEVDQWFGDSSGNVLGMVVYHIDAARASSEEDAGKRASAIRDELQAKIPNLERLFKER